MLLSNGLYSNQGEINSLLTRLYGAGHGQRYALGSSPTGVGGPSLQDQLTIANLQNAGSSARPVSSNVVTDYSAFGLQYSPKPTSNFSNAAKPAMSFDSIAQPSYTPASAYQSNGASTTPVGTSGYGQITTAEQVANTLAQLSGQPTGTRNLQSEMGYADYLKQSATLDSQQRAQSVQTSALRKAGISNPEAFKALTPLQQGQALQSILASTKSTSRPPAQIMGENVSKQLPANQANPNISNLLGALSSSGADPYKSMGALNAQREEQAKAAGKQFTTMINAGELETRNLNGLQIPHMKVQETIPDPNGIGEKTVYRWKPLNAQQLRDYEMARGAGFISETPEMLREPNARQYATITPERLQANGYQYSQPIGPEMPSWLQQSRSPMSPLDQIAVAMTFGQRSPYTTPSASPLPYRY